MSHLPYQADEEEYVGDGVGRYEQLRADLDEPFDAADAPDDSRPGTAVAGAVVAWLATQQTRRSLRPSSTLPRTPDDREWFDDYTRASYAAGRQAARAFLDELGTAPRTPGISQSPTHQRALQEAYERQRQYWGQLASDLRNEVDTAVRETIENGGTLGAARSAADDRLVKVGKSRAQLIGESEPAWAFNRSMLAEYKDAGRNRVEVDARWETAGDNRVCAMCAARSGVYTIGEMENLMAAGDFPAHGRCRCVLLPTV